MSEKIVFEEPPVVTAGNFDHYSVAEKLRARPGEWARVKRYASGSTAASMAQSIKRGKLAAYPEGDFDARSVTLRGQAWVYIRFIGEGFTGDDDAE